MDPSLNQSSPQAEEDDWDTDGFVIPSLAIGDSDLASTDVPGVTDPKPPVTTVKEAEKIYLGPHGAPPQAKQQELNTTGRKLRFKHKIREADRRFSGTGFENKVDSLQQLVGYKASSGRMSKSSPRDWLDPHCHESQFEKNP